MANQKILVEDLRNVEKIPEEEVIEYAKQIGIDVENEKHLMWIAHEGIQAPVPQPWFPVEDEKGNIYYFNQRTGESVWDHPSDAYFCTLVIAERDFLLRNKSLNTTCSDPGFESKTSLETIYDVKDAPRFNKNPLPTLSSLADAPPLSSSGNKTLASLSKDSTKTLFSGKSAIGKLDMGLDGNKLAPMKLDSLNKSQSSPLDHLSSKSSAFPKGSMVKNVKKGKLENLSKSKKKEAEFTSASQRIVKFDLDDNSEEGSHYSYEETDYEGDDFPDVEDMILDRFGILDASQLSPVNSVEGSPEPLDVNSLVKMKLSDNSLRVPHPYLKGKGKTNLNDDEGSTSSNSRKIEKKQEQNSLKSLKPLETKKFSLGENLRLEIQPTESPKSEKSLSGSQTKQQKSNSSKRISEKSKAVIEEEQNAILENLLQKWKIKQDEFEKEEEARLEKMKVEWDLRFKEEQEKLRKEQESKIQQLREEISGKMEMEETALKLSLDNMKSSNADKLLKEQKKYEAELNESREVLQKETEEKKANMQQELNEQVAVLEVEHQKNIEKIKEEHNAELKKIEEEIQTEDGEEKASEEKGKVASELKEMEELIEKDKQKLLDLQQEISVFEDQKKSLGNELAQLKEILKQEGQALKELQDEKLLIQKDIEELQEESEKIENDLDMLRSEKTAMFNELTKIKDEITKEKVLIHDLRKEEDELAKKKCEISETSVQVKPVSEDKQISAVILTNDESCQVEILKDIAESHVEGHYCHENKESVPVDALLAGGKTNMEEVSSTGNVAKSHPLQMSTENNSHSQDDTTKGVEEKASSQQINENKNLRLFSSSSSTVLSEEKPAREVMSFQHTKKVENLPEQLVSSEEKSSRHHKDMQEFYTKIMSEIDNKMKFVEQYMKSLEDRLPAVSDSGNVKETFTSVAQSNQNSTAYPLPSKSEHNNSAKQPMSTSVPQVTFPSHTAASSLNFPMNVPATGSKSCYCELGDSCEILLGLKHSLHHLQQQVHQQFVPPWTNCLLQKRFHTSNSQDSQLEDFRSGLKQLRDRHNSTLLRFRLEENVSEKSSSVLDQIPGTSRDTPELQNSNQPSFREFPVYYNGWMSSSPTGSSNEAIIRARDIVRREQERSRIQSLHFTRQSPPLYESYSFQASHSGLQVPSSSNNHPFSIPAQLPPLDSPVSAHYGMHFRQMRPEVVTEHEIKADLEAWLARIQGMHQRIRKHDRL